MAETLLVTARAYLAKINMYRIFSNIEDAVKEEKKSFLQAIHALLFPQLKQINLKTLKNRLGDLECEKRLIEKLTTSRDEEKKVAFFTVIDKCCDEIKKAREKIKKTKSYDEIKIITGSLARFKVIYKSAKAEFDKYLAANTAAPTYLPPTTSATLLRATPVSNSTPAAEKPSTEEGINGGDDVPLEQDVVAVTDDFVGSDSDESQEAFTEKSSTPLTVGSRTPSGSRSSSQSPAHSSPRFAEDLTGDHAEIAKLDTLDLELKKKAEAGKLEEQALVETIRRLEREALEKQHAQLDAEYRAAQQAADEARRVADELAAQNAREEQSRLGAIQKAEEEARQRTDDELAAQKVHEEQVKDVSGTEFNCAGRATSPALDVNAILASSAHKFSAEKKAESDYEQVSLKDQVYLF